MREKHEKGVEMKRDELLVEVRKLLLETGFFVSEPLSLRGISFDLVARRDKELLILKILLNVDALSKEDATQLKTLSTALNGRTAIIGIRSSSGKLEEGIIYSRFNMPIFSFDTLNVFLKEGVPPFIFAAPGGLYVRLNSDLIREIRKQRNISLGTLAEIAGVSRKAIQMYEEGMGAVIEVAMRLEEFLNEPIVMPLDPFICSHETESQADPFSHLDKLDAEVFRMLETIGYSVLPVAKCPFEAITTDEYVLLLTGVERYGPGLERKAKAVANISKVTEKIAMIITDAETRKKILLDTPLIFRDELAKANDKKKILDLIEERSKQGD